MRGKERVQRSALWEECWEGVGWVGQEACNRSGEQAHNESVSCGVSGSTDAPPMAGPMKLPMPQNVPAAASINSSTPHEDSDTLSGEHGCTEEGHAAGLVGAVGDLTHVCLAHASVAIEQPCTCEC